MNPTTPLDELKDAIDEVQRIVNAIPIPVKEGIAKNVLEGWRQSIFNALDNIIIWRAAMESMADKYPELEVIE